MDSKERSITGGEERGEALPRYALAAFAVLGLAVAGLSLALGLALAGDDDDSAAMRPGMSGYAGMMGAMAQMERELIGERTRLSLQYKKSQGESLGLVPFGYRRVAGKLEPDQEEQAIVGKMRSWKEAGESYRGIARRLQEEGIKPRRPGYGWNAATIRVILRRQEDT